MARSVNRATLVGNIGQDPELRSTPGGRNVCSFRMATSEAYKDSNGEWKEITDWHTVVCWDNLAVQVAENFRKGTKVYVEGKIKHRSYEGKDGVTRHVTEVIANTVISLGSRKSNDNQEKDAYDEPEFEEGTPDDDVPF
ncbi:MAG: single-stranded DNA-binding protein [Bacteroidota bacterium]